MVFCPPEVTQAELRRRVRALLQVFDEMVGRAYGLYPTATQVAAMLGTRPGLEVAHTPLEVEAHDVLRLDGLARLGPDPAVALAVVP